MATALLVAELPSIAFAAYIYAAVIEKVWGGDNVLGLVLASFLYLGARWISVSLADAALIEHASRAIAGAAPASLDTWRAALRRAHRVGLFKLAVVAVGYAALYPLAAVGGVVHVVSDSPWLALAVVALVALALAPVLLTLFLWSVYAQQFAVSRDLGLRAAFAKARRHLGSRLRRSLELAVAYAVLPAVVAAAAFVLGMVASSSLLVPISLAFTLLAYALRSLVPATLLAHAVAEDATLR